MKFVSDTKCPLWVISRHDRPFAAYPLYPRKRTFVRFKLGCPKVSGADIDTSQILCDSIRRSSL